MRTWFRQPGRITGIVALLALSATSPTFAADAPAQTAEPDAKQMEASIENGRQLAKDRCSACHAIGVADASKNKEAPPFRSFARKWPLETLEEPLAEGIVTGHDAMPEFVFEPDEIAAFLAFLGSFEKKK